MPGGKIPQGGCQLGLPCVGHDADKARRQQGVRECQPVGTPLRDVESRALALVDTEAAVRDLPAERQPLQVQEARFAFEVGQRLGALRMEPAPDPMGRAPPPSEVICAKGRPQSDANDAISFYTDASPRKRCRCCAPFRAFSIGSSTTR